MVYNQDASHQFQLLLQLFEINNCSCAINHSAQVLASFISFIAPSLPYNTEKHRKDNDIVSIVYIDI